MHEIGKIGNGLTAVGTAHFAERIKGMVGWEDACQSCGDEEDHSGDHGGPRHYGFYEVLLDGTIRREIVRFLLDEG